MTVLVSMVKQMIARGQPIRAIACASTGDTSAALAAYAAAAGIRAVVILPRGKISTAQLVQPLAMGALVLAIDTDFDGCMRLVQELARARGRLPRELDELAAHRGPEDGRDRDRAAARLDRARLGRHPRRQPRQRVGARRRLRDAARARPRRSAPAHLRRAGRAREPALRELPARTGPTSSRSRRRRRSRRRSRSATRSASRRPCARCARSRASSSRSTETELADASARADRDGLFTCPHTGVALGALEKLAARGEITKDQRVVVISTASGLKFADFKVGYHEGTLAEVPAPKYRNVPVELPERLRRGPRRRCCAVSIADHLRCVTRGLSNSRIALHVSIACRSAIESGVSAVDTLLPCGLARCASCYERLAPYARHIRCSWLQLSSTEGAHNEERQDREVGERSDRARRGGQRKLITVTGGRSYGWGGGGWEVGPRPDGQSGPTAGPLRPLPG